MNGSTDDGKFNSSPSSLCEAGNNQDLLSHNRSCTKTNRDSFLKVTRHVCCKTMQKSDPPCTFPSYRFSKDGLAVELLRDMCKGGSDFCIILQHTCLVPLSARYTSGTFMDMSPNLPKPIFFIKYTCTKILQRKFGCFS